jgi:hypothetical protein
VWCPQAAKHLQGSGNINPIIFNKHSRHLQAAVEAITGRCSTEYSPESKVTTASKMCDQVARAWLLTLVVAEVETDEIVLGRKGQVHAVLRT